MGEDAERREKGDNRAETRGGAMGSGLGSTRFGAAAFAVDPATVKRPFDVGARVKVSRLRTRQFAGDRVGDLGRGRLVDELAVGRALRVEVEWGPALVTSPVRAIERVGLTVVRVVTTNSVYQLERASSGDTSALPPRRSAGGGLSPQESTDGATSFVSLADLTAPEGVPFGVGTRVRIFRRKSADPSAEEFEPVGSGQVLAPVEAGSPARLAVDGGPAFVTSPVRKLRLLDRTLIEFETTNSVYRLERQRSRAANREGPSAR